MQKYQAENIMRKLKNATTKKYKKGQKSRIKLQLEKQICTKHVSKALKS